MSSNLGIIVDSAYLFSGSVVFLGTPIMVYKIVKTIKEIQNPNKNLSYCKISLYIQYLLIMMLITIDIYTSTQILKIVFNQFNVTGAAWMIDKVLYITRFFQYIQFCATATQVYEWMSMRLIIIWQRFKHTDEALCEMQEPETKKKF